MPLTNAYITLQEFKDWINQTATATAADEARMETAINGACRVIDEFTHRRFWQDSALVQRLYTAEETDVLFVDDISTSTGLIVETDDNDDGTYETAWTSGTDFRLMPLNAAVESPVRPWTFLKAIGTKTFPTTEAGVRVTAKFGWPAVPPQVKEIALIQAHRYYERKGAPFGVLGAEGFGYTRLPRLDPDFCPILEPLQRLKLVAV